MTVGESLVQLLQIQHLLLQRQPVALFLQ